MVLLVNFYCSGESFESSDQENHPGLAKPRPPLLRKEGSLGREASVAWPTLRNKFSQTSKLQPLTYRQRLYTIRNSALLGFLKQKP